MGNKKVKMYYCETIKSYNGICIIINKFPFIFKINKGIIKNLWEIH